MIFIVLPMVLIALFLGVGVIWFSPEIKVKFYLWRGNNRKARKLLEYLLEQDPQRINLYTSLAEIYYSENRIDKKALKLFDLILKLQVPFQWKKEILPLVAKYYIAEGRTDSEATQLIERAVANELEIVNQQR
ncbi:MAG: tetratricopeptide repeat protein [bacterium]